MELDDVEAGTEKVAWLSGDKLEPSFKLSYSSEFNDIDTESEFGIMPFLYESK